MSREELGYPSFASSEGEIRRAVERGAIQRGQFLVSLLGTLDMESVFRTVDRIAAESDQEVIHEQARTLNIEEAALASLDNADPPIRYSQYFCTPEVLVEYPRLVLYYRNVAMLSRKVMKGIDLDSEAYELGTPPVYPTALALARYFNTIVSGLILAETPSSNRHREIVLANLGDSLGGSSRNEVGRVAYAFVIRVIATHLHRLGVLESISLSLKGRRVRPEEAEDAPTREPVGKRQNRPIGPGSDLEMLLSQWEEERVKYHSLTVRNGNRLLLDQPVTWRDSTGKAHKMGPDIRSARDGDDMIWAGELKGGADPAGSDEHWKTATRAFDRILEASKALRRRPPPLAFMATIIVERVADEAQKRIDAGTLARVYNLTQVLENDDRRESFARDLATYLGYPPDEET